MQMENKIVTVDLKLESVEEGNGRFFFTAVSLDTNFEPVEGLKKLAIRNVNKDYIWRHEHPLEDLENEVFGRVESSWVTDEKLYSKYEVFDYDNQKKVLIELIKKRLKINDPLGVSMRYRKYWDKDLENVIHYDVFEHSGTPIPACEKCKSLNYEVIKLSEQENEKPVDEVLEETKKRIAELEASLNQKTECFEKLQTEFASLEKEVKVKEDAILEKEEKSKTLEEKVNDLMLEVEYFKKKPIIDQMLEIKKLDEKHVNFYKTQDEEYLKVLLGDMKLEAESKIQVKTMEESANDSSDAVDRELEKDKNKKMKKPTFEEFTKELNLKKKK